MTDNPTLTHHLSALDGVGGDERIVAARNWKAERASLRISHPWWPMPSWSRAPAWRKRPYLMAAKIGEAP